MSECEHITKMTVWSPHTQQRDGWSREAQWRDVRIWYNPNMGYAEMEDEKLNSFDGMWEHDGARPSFPPNTLKRWKFCPLCGKRLGMVIRKDE